MQLVNIDTPQQFISQNLIDAINSKNLSEATELVKDFKNVKEILRSLYQVSSTQSPIENYNHSAIVYTDAVVEIIKRLFPDEVEKIISASLTYYCSQQYLKEENKQPKDLEIDPNAPIVVAKLAETIAAADVEMAYFVAKRLLSVIDSKKFFNELLLELASKTYTSSGEAIIFINSVCKALEFFEWKEVDDLVWIALKMFTSDKLKSQQKKITPSEKEIKYAEFALKAASDPGEHGTNLLFIAHARQVYRSTSVKYKEIWAYLSSFILEKIGNIKMEKIDELEPVKGDESDFKKSFEVKDAKLSLTFANQLIKTGKTSSQIFRIVTLHMLENNQFINPQKVIYLNTARRLSAALGYPRNVLVLKSFFEYLYSE